MQKWRKIVFIVLVGVLSLTGVGVVRATTYTSTHYQVNQILFGSGGCLSTVCSSAHYQAQVAVGEVVIPRVMPIRHTLVSIPMTRLIFSSLLLVRQLILALSRRHQLPQLPVRSRLEIIYHRGILLNWLARHQLAALIRSPLYRHRPYLFLAPSSLARTLF